MILDKFEQLKRRYISSFGQKQTDLNGAWNERAIGKLERLLHKLAGSSGSYEFDQLSQLCRQAIACISNGLEIHDPAQFEGCLNDMFTEMSKYSE